MTEQLSDEWTQAQPTEAIFVCVNSELEGYETSGYRKKTAWVLIQKKNKLMTRENFNHHVEIVMCHFVLSNI